MHGSAGRRRRVRSRASRSSRHEPAGSRARAARTGRIRRAGVGVIRPAEVIQRKRDGEELPDDVIAELILGYARGEVPDYQMAAFTMAVYFRGLTPRET